MPPAADLHALLRLVESSISTLTSAGGVPALDDLSSKASTVSTSPTALGATDVLVSACNQLIASVQPPTLTLYRTVANLHLSWATRAAIESLAADALLPAGPNGLHVREIAKLRGADERKLTRVLRVLAAHHIFREVSPNVFAHTRLSLPLAIGTSLEELAKKPFEKLFEGSNGFAALLSHSADDILMGAPKASEFVLDSSSAVSPFTRATGEEVFAYYGRPENKAIDARFQEAMHGLDTLVPGNLILKGYPFSDLPEDSLVVDVAGGIGSVSLILARALPDLRFQVQDQPNVIAQAEAFWKREMPDALADGRVSLKAQDIFKPNSTQGADVYFLRAVLHDWTDDQALEILRNVRSAASPSSRLLIVENIVHPICAHNPPAGVTVEPEVAPLPPEPLIPHAGQFSAITDMNMMIIAGEDRILQQHAELMEQAGWKLKHVYGTGIGNCQLLATPT